MARGRSLAEFQQEFPNDESCAAFLFERRWPDGFVCPGCGERRAALLKTRARLYECLDCGRQTSVTAGTIMHRSKLPLTSWFWAAHLMTTHSNGMSARQLADQLSVTYNCGERWLIQIGTRSKGSSKSIRRRSHCVKATPSSNLAMSPKSW